MDDTRRAEIEHTGTDATATFDVTAGAVNGSRAMPRIEGGVAFVQTPYSGSNHGNIDGMKWIGCTFNNGLSTGGRNVEVIGCTGYGNMGALAELRASGDDAEAAPV